MARSHHAVPHTFRLKGSGGKAGHTPSKKNGAGAKYNWGTYMDDIDDLDISLVAGHSKRLNGQGK
jgi:hypothetical protein